MGNFWLNVHVIFALEDRQTTIEMKPCIASMPTDYYEVSYSMACDIYNKHSHHKIYFEYFHVLVIHE